MRDDRKTAEATSAGQARVLEMIASGAPLTDVLEELLHVIERDSPEMLGSILLLDDEGRHLAHAAAPSLPREYCRAVDGVAIGPSVGSCGTAAYLREQIIVEDIETDPLWEGYRQLASPHGLRACWSTPIVDPQRRVLGTFALYFRTPGRPTQRHDRLISMATFTAAIAIVKARGDQERARLLHDLGERVKELAVLHQVARLFQRERSMNRELLAELALLLPSGWQYPEICVARVAYGAMEARTPGWRETAWRQSAPFGTRDGVAGLIEVAYLEERPAEVEGPFLLEERRLVDSLAELVGEHFERIRSQAQVQQSLSRLQELSRRLISTEEEERRKINRELHDRIGQDLSTLSLNLDLIRSRSAQGGDVVRRLDDAKKLLDATIREVRNVMAELHPPGLDDLGLLAALRMHAEGMVARTGLPVQVRGEDLEPRLQPTVEMSLFRVAQEALANAAKHARASRVEVTLSDTPRGVTLTISDDGAGFDAARVPSKPSWGISIMRERAQAAGLTLSIDSAPGGGTRVVIEGGRRPA
jgi:signal transduction histidine kinase